MPSKKPHTCPVCHRPSVINLCQHLYGVHGINGEERKQLLLQEKVTSEANETNSELWHSGSYIQKHISFLDMLQRGEYLRMELLKKSIQDELKTILELCLNMKEGNLSLPKRKPHSNIVSILANRDIPLTNKKKWMLKYNKVLYNIIHSAFKEWKAKSRLYK